jgi:hypothetical protein
MVDASIMINDFNQSSFGFGSTSQQAIRAFARTIAGTALRLTLTSWLRPERRFIDDLVAALPAFALEVGARGIEFDVEEAWSRGQPNGFSSHEAAANYLFDALTRVAGGLEQVVNCQVDALGSSKLAALAQRAGLLIPQAYSTPSHAVGTPYGPRGLQDRAVTKVAQATRASGRPMLMGLAAYNRTGWPRLSEQQLMRLELAHTCSLMPQGVAGARYWSWKHIAGFDGRGGNSYASAFFRSSIPTATPSPAATQTPAPRSEDAFEELGDDYENDAGDTDESLRELSFAHEWIEASPENDLESTEVASEAGEDLESLESDEALEADEAGEDVGAFEAGEDVGAFEAGEDWPTSLESDEAYGGEWDGRICAAIDGLLNEFSGVSVTIAGRAQRVHTPYFMNVGNRGQARPATLARYDRAQEQRRNASSALRALISEPRFRYARVAKPTPQELQAFLQAAADQNLIGVSGGGAPDAAACRAFMRQYGIGLDCSGFVSQAINQVIALFNDASDSDRIADVRNTGSASLKGDSSRFVRIRDPRDLCAGDTMWLSGHIRIISRAEARGSEIWFYTAESRAGNGDVGPTRAVWRLVPDASITEASETFNFVGYRLQRGSSADSTTPTWHNGSAHTYSRFRPLIGLLERRGVRSTPLGASPAPAAPRASEGLETRPLTQPEIDRLAPTVFRNAADIQAFFTRRGVASFAHWFNANLGKQVPFGSQEMRLNAAAQGRFTAFWNQIPVAYDRNTITILDFAALMCIVLNETGGDFSRHSERCGGGRSDARSQHAGLAYAFDKIEGVKGSYNNTRLNQTAGRLFNNQAFIDAHGSLAGASRLARQGDAFDGAWNSSYYPQGPGLFTTDEDLAVNGFIMQADFYKFRGRGIIQTTHRAAYKRIIQFIQGYSGSNPTLLRYKGRWQNVDPDTAATISSNDDWDNIFDVQEILAKGLSLHSGRGANDYRIMSTRAEELYRGPEGTPNDIGVCGSIYAMGKRISGRRRYGEGIYRDRVNALLLQALTLV